MLKYDCLHFYLVIMFLLSSLCLGEGWLGRTKAFQGCRLRAHEPFSPDRSNKHVKYILKSFFIMFCLITFEIEVSFLLLQINIELIALININQNCIFWRIKGRTYSSYPVCGQPWFPA